MSYMGLFYEKEREQIRKIAHEEALAVLDEKMCSQTPEENHWMKKLSQDELNVVYTSISLFAKVANNLNQDTKKTRLATKLCDELVKEIAMREEEK